MEFLDVSRINSRSLLVDREAFGNHTDVILTYRNIEDGGDSLVVGAAGELERRASALDHNLSVFDWPVLGIMNNGLYRAKNRCMRDHASQQHHGCCYKSCKSPEHRVLQIPMGKIQKADASARKRRAGMTKGNICCVSGELSDGRTAVRMRGESGCGEYNCGDAYVVFRRKQYCYESRSSNG